MALGILFLETSRGKSTDVTEALVVSHHASPCQSMPMTPPPSLISTWSFPHSTGSPHKDSNPLILERKYLRVLLDKLDTLLNVALELANTDINELLLVRGHVANRVNLLDTVRAKLDVGGEVSHALVLEERALNESRLNDALLALRSLEQGLGEARTSHSHGQSSRAGAALGLHDLVTTKLHALDVLVALGALEGVSGLAEQRDDGLARVAADDCDVLVGWVGALELGDEAGGADYVEGGDAEEALWVVDALALEDLGGDGDGAVDRVGDDEDVGVRAVLGAGLGEVADDGGVGVEEVLT